MNAVEKLGSFISRGVYTVSGPFHPFGGAVDIIVVQQPDGSFKSSPWYVRFGKFQGVFNMKEKIVSICVNGAEAGFHMYLDHKGEAHFLREPEAEEEESAYSPPNSGDEVEESSGNAQLRNIQNCNCDGIMSDLVTPIGTGNGKILIRTDSQRSRIPGRMLSRRSMEGSDQDEGFERVNSLERAEIAANLLELNWSTNLMDRKGSQKKQADKKHVPPKKQADKKHVPPKKSAIEKGERHQITFLDVEHDPEEKIHSSRWSIGDNFETSIIRREILEERTICNSVNLRREEMINEANSSESEGTTLCAVCIDQRPKKSVENSISDSSGAIMNTANQLAVINSCGNMVTEVHFEESISQISVLSAHEEVLEIYTSEIGDSAVRNELTSNSVDVEQSEVKGESNPSEVIFNAQSPEALMVQALKETFEAAAVEVSDTENGEQEAMCCKNLESSSVISGISYEKTSSATHLTFPPNSSLADEFKEHYEVLDEVSSAGLHQKLEFTSFGVSSLSRNVQAELLNVAFPNGGVSADFCPPQNAGLMRSDFENICQDIVTEEINQKVERSAMYFSFPGSQQKEEPLHLFSNALLMPDHSTGSDSESKSYCTGSFCDSLNESAQLYKIERFKENGVKESCLSNMVNKSEDSYASSRPIEEVEVRVKSTESSEEDDFLFNDIDGFVPYKTRLDISFGPINDKGKPLLYAEGDDVEEHSFRDASDAESSEGLLDDSNTQTSPMTIPRSKIYLEDSQISAKSLPAIRSHIHDLERSHQPYSLSSSLNLPSEKKNGDSSTMECFETLAKDDGSQSKVMQKNYTYETVIAALDTKNHHKLKGNAVRPVVELSLCRNLLYEGMGSDAAFQAFNSEKVTLEKFYALGPSMLKNDKLVTRIGGNYFPGNSAAPINLQIIALGQEPILQPQDVIAVEHVEKNGKEDAFAARISSRGNWKLWPFGFKRSKTINIVQSTNESVNQVKPDAASMTMKSPSRENDIQKHMIPKKKVRWLTPNSEELASLNLKEGPNVVTFSFLTAMLGRQQVDARIYLWKWNTQIVISDVDGTITRSDVLGQFMPLVGMDWSQTGVTHLFSAIKENGYQLLFLSARAISQAYLTRQFLFNLKQDGKVLPHGPVVISPDGLFPSLYREVIRRAPHEFKISCLEAIRALFPTDCNPFYAGFGNRDTDEISYLKVGIPRGKIFIINPKGEVAVNRRIDTKSYSSLQALVNVMFPPMSSWEQEDFNSWNYWKMPLPEIVI